MDHRHLFLQDLLSPPPGSTQPELLLGGQQLQLTSPSYICKSFPPQQQSGRAVFPALHFISARTNLHLRFAAHRDATQCHSQSPAHWGRGQGQARSIQARGVTDTGGECSGAPAQPCTPGEPAENQLCGAVGAIPHAGLPAGDRTCEHEHGNTSCRGRGKLCQPGWPLWLGMEKGWGGERALQHRATAWLPKGQSAEPTDSFLGRAHLLSEQPGSPKDGLDELLARYRHQGAPGNTEHTGRERGDRTSPPALLATHRRLQARTGGAVHGREVGGLPVVPRCASHPHAPPVRPGASRRVLHPHPIPAAPVLTWWPHAHLPKDSLRAAADLLCLLGEALGSRGEV